MLDAKDDHFTWLLDDSIENPERPSPSGEDPCEISTEGTSAPLRRLKKVGGQELDDRGGHHLGEHLCKLARCWRSEDQFVSRTHRRSARTASMPRTTSPER